MLPSLTLHEKSRVVDIIKQEIVACLFRHAVSVEMPAYSDILLSLLRKKQNVASGDFLKTPLFRDSACRCMPDFLFVFVPCVALVLI